MTVNSNRQHKSLPKAGEESTQKASYASQFAIRWRHIGLGELRRARDRDEKENVVLARGDGLQIQSTSAEREAR